MIQPWRSEDEAFRALLYVGGTIAVIVVIIVVIRAIT
jgi:hypothetical protein